MYHVIFKLNYVAIHYITSKHKTKLLSYFYYLLTEREREREREGEREREKFCKTISGIF